MPGKTGLELCAPADPTRPNLRVIVMTGYRRDALAGFDDGIDLLQKPFAPKELRDRVRAALVHVRDNSR